MSGALITLAPDCRELQKLFCFKDGNLTFCREFFNTWLFVDVDLVLVKLVFFEEHFNRFVGLHFFL